MGLCFGFLQYGVKHENFFSGFSLIFVTFTIESGKQGPRFYPIHNRCEGLLSEGALETAVDWLLRFSDGR